MSNVNLIIRENAEFFARDYSQLFPNLAVAVNSIGKADWLFQYFAHPNVPILAIIAYLLFSKQIFVWIRNTFNVQPKGASLQFLTILHSAILAIYSIWTFVNTVRIAFPLFSSNGFYHTLCDVNGDVWFTHGMGFWITHFYLSKYYEFIDTWIVLLKGRTPIFLQTYHHAGIVILMWGFVVTANTCGGLITTMFNSFIHSLMYTYYTLAAFGISVPFKQYLTQAQMIQFIIGISLTVPAHFMSNCITPAQSLVNAAIQLYAVILIYLFYQFYKSSYGKSKKSKEGPLEGDSSKKAGSVEGSSKKDQ